MADEATFFGFWADRFETRQGDAEDFQEFAGYAWMGNSYQKLVLKSELEWRDSSIEESATELMYSKAVSPFWDLQFGGRVDHGDFAHRKWLAVGMKGLAPYWFEIDATAYLGPSGHTAAHFEVEYDLLLNQRLILQPKIGLDFYGDSDLEAGHGKGLSKSKMGVRLRYEFTRQIAPYIGYERIHHHGEAAEIFRVFNQHRENQWLAGIRFWF
jgi:copper resistance protein B